MSGRSGPSSIRRMSCPPRESEFYDSAGHVRYGAVARTERFALVLFGAPTIWCRRPDRLPAPAGRQADRAPRRPAHDLDAGDEAHRLQALLPA